MSVAAASWPDGEDPRERRERKEQWNEYRRQIRERLNGARPARVDEHDRAWREQVYGWARLHMPDETELVRRVAQREVDNQEGHATKRANDLLRDFWQGRAPLDWSVAGPWPVRVAGLRIRLDAATPADVNAAANELAIDLTKTHQAGLAAVQAMHFLAETATEAGLQTVAQIGDLPPRGMDEAA